MEAGVGKKLLQNWLNIESEERPPADAVGNQGKGRVDVLFVDERGDNGNEDEVDDDDHYHHHHHYDDEQSFLEEWNT